MAGTLLYWDTLYRDSIVPENPGKSLCSEPGFKKQPNQVLKACNALAIIFSRALIHKNKQTNKQTASKERKQIEYPHNNSTKTPSSPFSHRIHQNCFIWGSNACLKSA